MYRPTHARAHIIIIITIIISSTIIINAITSNVIFDFITIIFYLSHWWSHIQMGEGDMFVEWHAY